MFQGQVYFPVYEPPAGANRCNIGNAYICASDDECGTNNSHELIKGGRGNGSACVFVREGVLSELVISDNKLFQKKLYQNDCLYNCVYSNFIILVH